VAAVDEAFLVERDEDLAHGARQARVEREALARPVARDAEAAELMHDGAAGGFPPLPDPAFELRASQRPARLGPAELPLAHHLGGDPRMVGPRHPELRPAVHAVVPRKDVLEGAVEG